MPAKFYWMLATATQARGAPGADEAIATVTAAAGGHTNDAQTPSANTWTAFTTIADRAAVPVGGNPFSAAISAKIATGVGTLTFELEGSYSDDPPTLPSEWVVIGTVSHTFAATATQEWGAEAFDIPGLKFVRASRFQCTVANALSVMNGKIGTRQ